MISYVESCLKHWRTRHILIAILVAAAMVIFVLFSVNLAATKTRTLQKTALLQAVLFDAQVQLKPGDRQLDMNRLWPLSGMDTQIGVVRWSSLSNYIDVEYGYEFSSQSTAGALSVIGLSKKWLELTLSAEHLQGRIPATRQEILLPLNIANKLGHSLGENITLRKVSDAKRYNWELTVVGIYDSKEKQLPGIVLYEDALSFDGSEEPNCLLTLIKEEPDIPNDQQQRIHKLNLTSQRLASFLQNEYPGRQVIYPDYPMQLSAEMHISVHGFSYWLLLLIFLFIGIAVYTVIFITFLEKRKEMSSLKVIGISQNQVLSIYGGEYCISFAGGILGGVGLVLIARSIFPWFQDVTQSDLKWLIVQASLSCLALLPLTLGFPMVSVAIASVDELLHNRTIPLRRQRISRPPAGDYLAKKHEKEANLSVLKLTSVDGKVICLVLCSEGEAVKEGQPLAILDEYGGLSRRVWVAPHDGVVTLLEKSRYIGIRKTF